MPFDPNDPNQESQRSYYGDQSDPASQAGMQDLLNSRLRADPQIGQWLAQHNDGRGLTPSDTSQLKQLVLSRYGNAGLKDFAVASDGTFHSVQAHNSFWSDLAKGSAAVFAPIAASYAVPALFGASSAGAAGLGPSTAANIAATAGVTAPAGIAATTGGGFTLGLSGANLVGLAGTLGNVFSNIYGANKQQQSNDASLAAQRYATDAAIAQQGKTDAQQYAEFQAQQALAQQAQNATEKNNAATFDYQKQKDAETLAFQKQQAAISQDEWQKQFGLNSQQAAAAQELANKQYEQSKAQFEATQALSQKAFDFQKAQYDAAEARRAPYRAAGAKALSSLGTLLGMDFGPTQGAAPTGGGGPVATGGPVNPANTPLIQASVMAQRQQQQPYTPVIPMASLMRRTS